MRILGINAPFGGLAVLLVGDIGQLPPVKGKVLWDDKCTGDDANAFNLYNMFDVITKLTENVRLDPNDHDAKLYDDILKRLHDGNNTESDANLINEKCSLHRMGLVAWKDKGFDSNDAVHLFTTNREVDMHNKFCITQLGAPIALIEARHSGKGRKASSKDTMNLEPSMYLSKGSNVMITTNLCSSVVNGSRGIVQDLVFEEGAKLPALPLIVWTEIDTYTGPSFFPNGSGRNKWFPIRPITHTWW